MAILQKEILHVNLVYHISFLCNLLNQSVLLYGEKCLHNYLFVATNIIIHISMAQLKATFWHEVTLCIVSTVSMRIRSSSIDTTRLVDVVRIIRKCDAIIDCFTLLVTHSFIFDCKTIHPVRSVCAISAPTIKKRHAQTYI